MELYDNGVVLYDEGRYEDAIVAWEEAHRLSDRPALLYNIANAEERLGRYQEALDDLNRYRAWAKPDERTTLDRRISNLERRLEQQAVAANALPLSTPMPAPIVAVPVPVPVPVPAPAAKRTARVAPVVLYTIGGIGLATGGTLGAVASSARNRAGELCVPSGNSATCPASAADAIERDRTFSLFADVGYAVGIGGALGGTIALVVPHDRNGDRDRLEVSVLREPGGGAVRVTRRF